MLYPRMIFGDINHLFVLQNKARKLNFLKSKIKQNYHRLEKSMTKNSITLGRGKRAANELSLYLIKYANVTDAYSDIQFQTGLIVLEKYLLIHGKVIPDLQELFTSKLKRFIDKKISCAGGTNSFSKHDLTKNKDSNFSLLSSSRHSIRYFSPNPVSDDDIKYAVRIAQKSPSVCNRQGWKLWLIKNTNSLDTFKKVHNGFRSEDQNLTKLLVITFTKNSFSYPLERHQGYTDSGLFAMSLMHAFTHLGIATCPLNANLGISQEKEFRSAAGIGIEYGIVMFIAVGNYKENNICAVSQRDPEKDVIIEYDD